MENKRINCGFEIIYSSQVEKDLEIVLGRNLVSGEYVTWACKNRHDYFWGHYFSYEENALADLAERVKEERRYNGQQ